MWYALTGGAGILLGLGLLIWGLRERSARYNAERKADKQQARADDCERAATANARVAKENEDWAKRVENQATALKESLTQTRELLKRCQDPKIIREWLDSELNRIDL